MTSTNLDVPLAGEREKEFRGPRLTLMDAFNKTSTYKHDPEIGFGTGSRPSLVSMSNTPGPGAYQIKTTLKKTMDSSIESPVAYSIRSRQNFGNPNMKAMSKATAYEPGPGSYKLEDKFLSGSNSSKYSFPKQRAPMEKSQLAPGPGQYETPGSLGKHPLSTKKGSRDSPFSLSARPSLISAGTSDIGPGEYGVPSAACEQQIDSRKATKSAIRFGTGYTKNRNGIEKVDMSEPSPGPGSYVLPGGVATARRGDPYRSSPAPSLSGRNKFGSPW